MNILFAWKYQINPKMGGVERVTSLIMNGLSLRGYKCLFLECKNNYSELFHEGEKIENLKTFLIEKKINIIINQDGYSRIFSDLIFQSKWEGCYYVFFHNDPQMFSHLFSFKNILNKSFDPNDSYNIKRIFRIMLYPIWRHYALNNIRNLFLANYSQATNYLLLSTQFRENFIQSTGLSDVSKLRAIPNPLSFPNICDEGIIAKKKKEVLIVSRLYEQEKRISYCLNIWKIIERIGYDDWQLIIVGHGQDEENYKKLAKKIGLKRVKFLGKQDSYPYFCRSSIFMMTSKFEGWGLTLTESLQTGVVPIVMDSYPSLKDIIEHRVNGIIVPNNNLKVFANELQILMNSKEEREAMARRALISAKNFSLSSVLDKWEALFREKVI